MPKLTQEEVDKRLAVFKQKYDYIPFVYKNTDTPITAICPKHGEFTTSLRMITRGAGCFKCGVEKNHKLSTRTQEEFINLVEDRFKDKPLDFSETKYINSHSKIQFKCNLHGYKSVKPYVLLKSLYGCDECSYIARSLDRCISYENFVERSREKHGTKYDYSKSNVVDTTTPVEIICPKHQSFYQAPASHMRGEGCPRCKDSRGEKYIKRWLERNGVNHEQQYKIIPRHPVLFGRQFFKVDFYLPDYNTIIEFHGKQHYEKYEIFHKTDEAFQDQQDRDFRLREHCRENGISLIEIPYTQIKEIYKILDKKIGRLK